MLLHCHTRTSNFAPSNGERVNWKAEYLSTSATEAGHTHTHAHMKFDQLHNCEKAQVFEPIHEMLHVEPHNVLVQDQVWLVGFQALLPPEERDLRRTLRLEGLLVHRRPVVAAGATHLDFQASSVCSSGSTCLKRLSRNILLFPATEDFVARRKVAGQVVVDFRCQVLSVVATTQDRKSVEGVQL